MKQYDCECQTVTWLDCVTEIEGGVKLSHARTCTRNCNAMQSLGTRFSTWLYYVTLIRMFDGRSKVENGRTKLIVLGQIVHTLFKSNFIHCYDQSAVNLHVPKINFSTMYYLQLCCCHVSICPTVRQPNS